MQETDGGLGACFAAAGKGACTIAEFAEEGVESLAYFVGHFTVSGCEKEAEKVRDKSRKSERENRRYGKNQDPSPQNFVLLLLQLQFSFYLPSWGIFSWNVGGVLKTRTLKGSQVVERKSLLKGKKSAKFRAPHPSGEGPSMRGPAGPHLLGLHFSGFAHFFRAVPFLAPLCGAPTGTTSNLNRPSTRPFH